MSAPPLDNMAKLQRAADRAWNLAKSLQKSEVVEYQAIGRKLQADLRAWADQDHAAHIGQAAAAIPAGAAGVAATAAAAAALYLLIKLAYQALRNTYKQRQTNRKPEPKTPQGHPQGPWYAEAARGAAMATAAGGAAGAAYGVMQAPAGSVGTLAKLALFGAALYVVNKVL